MPVHGRFQIKRISPQGMAPATYQIIYEPFHGGEFAGSVEEDHLEEFLRERLRLKEDGAQALAQEAISNGHVIVSDAELSEADLAAAGLDYLSPAV